jgi:uncharacterized protein (TIGR02145 family)
MKKLTTFRPIASMVRMTLAILMISLALVSCKKADDPGDVPSNGDTFTDTRDGNVYAFDTIGTQVWMTQNLAYLPSVQSPSVYSDSSKSFYVGGYDGTDVAAARATDKYKTYGVLYNWPAAMDGSAGSDLAPSGVRGICPHGWHLPSDEEWKILERYLGMTDEGADAMSQRNVGSVGIKLKSTTGWPEGCNGDNSSGFNALPGGFYFQDHIFRYIGIHALFWTTSIYPSGINRTWSRDLGQHAGVTRDAYYHYEALSIRCVRN